METMDAMVLEGTGPVESGPLRARSDWPVPAPRAGEVRVRVRACGVCHTDLHLVEGDLDPLPLTPLVPGHQVVGVIDALGEGVSEHRVGDRVGVAWMHDTCGGCAHCASERENLCESARFTGMSVHGGYAEALVVPASFAYALPLGLDDLDVAPLLCAGVIGYRALRLSEIRPGGRLGMFGFGASAHIAIQVARHWRCEVFAFSRAEHHRELARELGAAWTGHTNEAPPRPLDAAINFTPSGEVAALAMARLDRGGTVACAGIVQSPTPPLDYRTQLYHERTLRSVANATRQDARDLLALAAEIPIKSHVETHPLADANVALTRMKQSKITGAAVLIVGDGN